MTVTDEEVEVGARAYIDAYDAYIDGKAGVVPTTRWTWDNTAEDLRPMFRQRVRTILEAVRSMRK